ncbi:MAG TPA: erythromycin esterase family protein [Dehalococcoidia bacterium]|nr:erythromycin esterase family protein [Dehalococcoidia bacterium]
MVGIRTAPARGTDQESETIAELQRIARPLDTDTSLDPLIERIGDARIVLLGEASHGTSEFYRWRARLSERLIRERGFQFVAVEGDWPDCYRVNRYVRGMANAATDAREALLGFERWPTWMWANWEIVAFAERLRTLNGDRAPEDRAGFYGLDVYSLWDSMAAVIEYLRRVDPDALPAALSAWRCFEPYGEDVQEYARATMLVPASCEADVVRMLSELRAGAAEYTADQSGDAEEYFNAEQNALVAKNAEHYYRTMVRGGADSWNVRDRHMIETLGRLLDRYGQDAKGIVWEHNTHIGDARYTDMVEGGMVNVGQLARERWGAGEVVLVGFGTYRGSVIAGSEWDAPMELMPVPPARDGSWDDLLHRALGLDRLLIFDGAHERGPLAEQRGQRAIGVVYRPQYERWGNYVPTSLGNRYDALLYIDETDALHPLRLRPGDHGEPPETYPWNT